MAISDEDWKNFLDSTEEDDDEVETDEKSEDEKSAEAEEAKKKKADESEDEAGKQTDADKDEAAKAAADADKGKGTGDADAGKQKSTDDDYKPRIKQFLKDDGSLNAEQIEKAYLESSKNGVALNEKLEKATADYEALLKAIKAKPDVAKALFGEEGAKKISEGQDAGDGKSSSAGNPLLRHIEAQMNNASRKEYNDFVDAHPEAVTDPEKVRKIGVFLKRHGLIYQDEHEGEIPGMKDSLEEAYRYYGWDMEIKNKEDVAAAAKKSAATRSTSNAGRKASKKETSQGEDFFAAKLGVKLK